MKKYNEMSNKQLVSEFNEIWKTSNVSRSNINRYIKNHYFQLYDEIEKRTLILNQYKIDKKHNGKLCDISIFERIYFLDNDLDDRPLCIQCKQKHVSGFMPYKNEYSQYCSHDCQCHSSIQAKRALEKKRQIYGEDNITNSKKAYKTRIEKYGTYHPESFVEKTKATKKRNHGDENYVNVTKIKETIERHIQENPNYYYDREQKTKATKIRNGHDQNWNNREKFKETISLFSEERKEKIKEKRKQTNLENYGYEYAMQNQDIKEKTKNTCIELYGVECSLNLEKTRNAANYAIREKAWNNLMRRNIDIEPLFTKEEFIENNFTDKEWKWKCKKCGHEFFRKWKNLNVHCPKCFVLNYHSIQNEIYDYVCSICKNDVIVRDDRKTFNNKIELDIFNVTKKIAIEFNGFAWHNVDKQIYKGRLITPLYHKNKTDMCENKGIRLIHIFEDEWIENKMLCKSKLKKILCSQSIMIIDAADCYICKNVSENEKMMMLEKYTFFPTDGSSVSYSLKLRNKTVAMMTFSRTRRDRIHDWQIINYAEMNSFVIKDGFKVLMNSFCNDNYVKNISYYALRDWHIAEDVNCMDFVEIKRPRMYWIKKINRVKGICINEKNMHEFIDNIDETKSFIQNMNDNGFYRIYDSGILMFEKAIHV